MRYWPMRYGWVVQVTIGDSDWHSFYIDLFHLAYMVVAEILRHGMPWFYLSSAWFLYAYVLVFFGELYGFQWGVIVLLKRKMFSKFYFVYSHVCFVPLQGFSWWGSYQRGFLASLKIGGYFWGYNSYPLYCTSLMLCHHVWDGFAPAH